MIYITPPPKKINKNKIIFCLPDLKVIGGIENALCETISALKTKNIFEISVIVFSNSIHPRYEEFFKKSGINFVNASEKENLPKFIRKHLRRYKVRQCLRQQDVIIDYKYTASYTFYRKVNRPKICWIHCGFNLFKNHLDPNFLSNYDKVICLTNNIVQEIKDNYSILEKKVTKIYNPINCEHIVHQSNEVMYQTDGRYFVAVQRLDPHEKDVGTIIRAFNIFAKSNKEVKLYIVGGGTIGYTEYLKSLCETDRIIFTGELNNPYSIIKNAEALILSSTKEVGEGLPMVLLEAQTLDTLCISSNVKSGPPEILMNGKAGLLFEQGNYEELSKIMTNVINGTINRAQIINCAKESLSRFSGNNSANDLIRVIEELNLQK